MIHSRKHLSRRAFTLIEILVVIGILAVLLGVAVVGFRALNKSATTKKTKMALSNAASVLAEYDAATSFRQQPNMMWDPGDPAGAKRTADFDIWKDANSVAKNNQPVPAPAGSVDAEGEKRLKYQAVLNTAVVLREAGRMPNAKRMMSQLPGESQVNVTDPTSTTTPPATIGPVLLDGWGNPIIFVPASGLADVYMGDPAVAYVVRSNKVYAASDTAGLATIPAQARPFFASAGPDGVFGFIDRNGNGVFDAPSDPAAGDGDLPGGDDNIYSFEN